MPASGATAWTESQAQVVLGLSRIRLIDLPSAAITMGRSSLRRRYPRTIRLARKLLRRAIAQTRLACSGGAARKRRTRPGRRADRRGRRHDASGLTARRLGIATHHAIGRGRTLRQADRRVIIGGTALGYRPGDHRHGKNQTQAPQDSLPFAIEQSQHNEIGPRLEHASQQGHRRTLRAIAVADRYAVRMYSRISAVSRSICRTRCLTTSPIDTIPTRRP